MDTFVEFVVRAISASTFVFVIFETSEYSRGRSVDRKTAPSRDLFQRIELRCNETKYKSGKLCRPNLKIAEAGNGTGVSVVRGKSNSMQSGESDAKQFVTMEGRSMFQENRAGRAAINSPSPRDPWEPRHEPTVSSRPWRIVSLIFLLAVQRGEEKTRAGNGDTKRKHEANIQQRTFIFLY